MDIRSITPLPRAYQDQLNISNNRKDKKNQSTQSNRDQVELSSQGLEFSQTLKTMKNSPEIRAEKVKELSEKINAGAYHVASSEIAEAIVNYSKSY